MEAPLLKYLTMIINKQRLFFLQFSEGRINFKMEDSALCKS